MMTQRAQIRDFYDQMAVGRDETIASDPLLRYEQEMRQRGVHELLRPSPEDVVLDLGCGNARDIRALMHHATLRIVGIDYSMGMLEEGKASIARDFPNHARRVSFLRADGTALPFAAGSFDAVVCSEVIEHVPDYPVLLNEVHRVLKPGGRTVVTTPNMHSIYGLQRAFLDRFHAILGGGSHRRADHPYDVWRTRSAVKAQLSQAGFEVERELGLCYLPGELTYRLPRQPKEWLVRLTAVPEWLLRKSGAGGYMMAVLAMKSDASGRTRGNAASP